MILAGKRQTLMASKKNAVEVPTLPLEIQTGDVCNWAMYPSLPGHDVGWSELWKILELLSTPAFLTSRARQGDPGDKASGGKAGAIFLPVFSVVTLDQISHSRLWQSSNTASCGTSGLVCD